jgi:hypothetical protein
VWSLSIILREEYRLRMCENRVLRKIFVPKRGNIIGGLRKLHVACVVEKRNVYLVLMGRLVGNRQLGRCRHK